MATSSLDSTIAKIKALRALATSSNVHEAAAAAAQAEAMLQKYRLDEAALEGASAPKESAREEAEPLDWHTQFVSWWRVALGSDILKNHGCVDYITTRGARRCHVIVGRPSDVATVRYLYAWLTTEISRLCERYGKGKGRSWRNSFCVGAVAGIREAMTAAKSEARRTATSSALVAVDRRDADAKAVLVRNQPSLRRSAGGARASDRGAYGSGLQAGRNIHLGAALAASSSTPALGAGRAQ